MRFTDLLGISLAALWQQKVRTLLTMAGVVIGTFALVACLSLCQGFEREVMRQLYRGALTRQVMVWPGSGVRETDIPADKLHVSGPMSEAKRQRIRQAIIHRWPLKRRGIQLDRRRVHDLARLPHVRSAVPLLERRCQVALAGQPPQNVLVFAANADNQHFRNRIVAGDYLAADTGREAVVSEYLLYRWGLTDDDEVESAVGKTLRLEYRPGGQTPRYLLSLLQGSHLDLPAEQKQALDRVVKSLARPAPKGPALWAEDFTIVGVMREFGGEQDFNDIFDLGAGLRSQNVDVYLPARTAAELFSRGPAQAALGFPGVTLTVDRESHVKELTRKLRRMGLREYSLAEFVQGLRTNLVLITFVTAFLAAVALLVAALGITNTMIMTVLERTREIGVMKAVGARDVHIQTMFLLEGALIGLIGGGLGVLLSWAASIPGDAVARSLLQDQSLPALRNTLFVFPPWLTLGAPAFAGLVTTLAAVYPARRATRVNPILALRHE